MDEKALIEQIRKHNRTLKALETGLEASPPTLNGIKALAFDIYGTLLISGTGDISHASSDDRNQAIIETLQDHGVAIRLKTAPLGDLFTQLILQAQEGRKADNIEFPEVDILQIWKYLLIEAVEAGWIDRYPDQSERELMAVDYECRINPVAPMPGLLEVLQELRDRNVVLCIVSNAQFFTPLLFSALLDRNLDQLGFDPNCSVWSWQLREAKPSRELYRLLAEKLDHHHGIQPGETLYVGNDMRNDVAPAAVCGFKTALFAGDQRSLRLREGDPLVEGIRPNGILTSLKQLIQHDKLSN